MALNDTPRLPCGRPVDQVWIDLESPPTPHEQGCVYCQAARRSLDDLTAATQALQKADDTNPDLQPSASMTANVMRVARAEVRRARRIPLDEPLTAASPDISLTISEQAVAAVIRHIADTSTEGAEARHCRIEVDLTTPAGTVTNNADAEDSAVDSESTASSDVDSGGVDGSGAATRLLVELTISLPAGKPLTTAADSLRTAIAHGVRDQLGLTTSRINIVVEDLHDLT